MSSQIVCYWYVCFFARTVVFAFFFNSVKVSSSFFLIDVTLSNRLIDVQIAKVAGLTHLPCVAQRA